MARRRLLQLDHVKLVRHLERRRQILCQRMLPVRDIDAKFSHRRMVEKKASQRRVMAQLDHLARPALLAHSRGLSAAGAMQCEPASARLEPIAHEPALRVIQVRPRHVGDHELASRQPLVDVFEVVADGRMRVLLFLQQFEDAHARVVHVMPGDRTGRESSGDDVYPDGLAHRDASPRYDFLLVARSFASRKPLGSDARYSRKLRTKSQIDSDAYPISTRYTASASPRTARVSATVIAAADGRPIGSPRLSFPIKPTRWIDAETLTHTPISRSVVPIQSETPLDCCERV